MNPSILHFSRWGNVFKTLFFAGFAALAFVFAVLLHREADAPPQRMHLPDLDLPAPAPHRDPLAPVKIPFLVVAGCVCLFYAGRHGARAIARQVAVRIVDGQLHFHPSYTSVPPVLPVADVAKALFDRADRLPGEGDRAARLGARLRHGLYLRYRTQGAAGELRLVDNDFDGGTEQLCRFAAHLEAWRQSAARTTIATDCSGGEALPEGLA